MSMHDEEARPIRSLDDVQPDPRTPTRARRAANRCSRTRSRRSGPAVQSWSDRHGVVIAGNKTFKEAKALGLDVRVVDADGRALVVVRRTNLDLASDPEARQLALADNRVGEVNLEWDRTCSRPSLPTAST